MATRFYLLATQTNPYGGIKFDLGPSPGASVVNRVKAAVSGSVAYLQWTQTSGGALVEWITGPALSTFTLTSTNISIGVSQSANNTNTQPAYDTFRIDPLGVETDINFTQTFGTESTTAILTKAWTANNPDIVINAGDRIILRVYLTNGGGTQGTGTSTLSTNAASGVSMSWLELAETVSFGPPSAPIAIPGPKPDKFDGITVSEGVTVFRTLGPTISPFDTTTVSDAVTVAVITPPLNAADESLSLLADGYAAVKTSVPRTVI